MKVCRKCGETKLLSAFSRESATQDGLRRRCRACDAANDAKPEHKARRAAYNRTEAGKAAFRKYRRTEKGRARDNAKRQRERKDPSARRRKVRYSLKYQATPKGRVTVERRRLNPQRLVYVAEWRNRPGAREKIRAWARAGGHQRRARERRLDATLTPQQWSESVHYFNMRCAYCGSARPLLQEHFVPLSAGGPYTASNIVPACQPCNNRKRNKMPDMWCAPDVYARVLAYFSHIAHTPV